MPKKKKPERRRHGEGTIYQREDGRYEAKVTVYDPISGKAKRKSIYDKDPDTLYQKYIELQGKKLSGKPIDAIKTPTWQWVHGWLTTYKRSKSKPTTYDSYLIIAEKHIKPTIGDVPLGKLSSENLQHLYNEKLKDSGMTFAV
jgi:integrase